MQFHLHLLCTNYAPNHFGMVEANRKWHNEQKNELKSYDLARFFVHFVKNAGLSDKT